MIKANVILDNKKWQKYIKNPSIYIKNKLNKLSKFKDFKKKKEFSIMLTDNKNMKNLNKKFRKKNKHTDVLSFPFKQKKKIFNEIYLGDIIISFNHMNKPKNLNSKEFKEKTIKIFIHGFLHLLGYDHIIEKDYKKMFHMEQKVFRSIEKLLN